MWPREIVRAMDVSYSAWRQLTEERLTLKGESFSFLFDRRYTNRLNRMSRVFFEAYVRATKELAAQEDRFPSLSEIDAKMESGAVYAFKDRLTKNTEFFEEVKISGVSYLVPRAKMFVDSSGTYTELAFNFDEGTVVLPTRRKVPVQVEAALPEPEKADQLQKAKASIGEKTPETAAPSAIEIAPEPSSGEMESPKEKETPADTQQEVPAYPEQVPEPFVDVAEEHAQSTAVAAKENFARPDQHHPEAAASSPEKKMPAPRAKDEGNRNKIKIAAVGLIALIIIVATGSYFFGLVPSGPAKLVYYSSFLSNTSQGNFLGLDITNRDGISDEIEMVLPPNIDKSISSRGGVITISHAGNTSIRLNTSSDASVRLYLSSNWTAVPVTLSLAVPKGYDSGLVVHGKDYDVKRRDDRIILRFNCTREGVSFEQSYSPKR
jgi:hypothetical protein